MRRLCCVYEIDWLFIYHGPTGEKKRERDNRYYVYMEKRISSHTTIACVRIEIKSFTISFEENAETTTATKTVKYQCNHFTITLKKCRCF